MTVAAEKTQKPELSNEQRKALKEEFKGLEKKYGLNTGDLFYQMAAYSFDNYLDLCSAAAKRQTGITDYKDETLKAKIAEIATTCGLPNDTKRNIISPQDLTDASILLWKRFVDDIRAFFASLKK